jgi:hypothetical protein
MAIQGYQNNNRFFTMSVASPTNTGGTNVINGISDLNITINRPVRYYKDLSDSLPQVVLGRQIGNINLIGFATDSISAAAMSSSYVFSDTDDLHPVSVITLEFKQHATSTPAASSNFTGFHVGDGFRFRRIEQRLWVMDGVQTFRVAT